MKKRFVAWVVLGVAGVAGVAQAQSSVKVYGVVDTGFVRKSGHDVAMGENVDNHLGFRGEEDLGSGMRATFELERRFLLNDGSWHGVEWAETAHVGLESNDWGTVRLGRLSELTTESIRRFDPFDQYGVAAMLEGHQRVESIDNTIRYDSPDWRGFYFGASYSLGGNTNSRSMDGDMAEVRDAGADHDGYAVMLGYAHGPLALAGNWSRLPDSARSSVWNLGAAYCLDDARLTLVYQQTRDKGWASGERAGWHDGNGSLAQWIRARYGDDAFLPVNDIRESQWLLGLEWQLGRGRLNASAQWMAVAYRGSAIGEKDVFKYALGYTYDLSKRTAVYGNMAYIDYADEAMARQYGDVDARTMALQLGVTHRF